jgi:hypothetical protein
MTSVERMYALHNAIGYVEDAGVPGDVVECGVWQGGSSMMAALTLLDRGEPKRDLWLYDTFEGMPEPTDQDVSFEGVAAQGTWQSFKAGDHNEWCYSPIDEVRRNIRSTGFPDSRLHFIQGKVEETIPEHAPAQISLLRLDTDWHSSTLHEMEHLFPRLAPGGVLIIDDYGHWSGAREAVDQYLAGRDIELLLNRVDYTARMAIVPR